ncbi:hypothetical protein [Bradyrhizobium sp. BR 10261]|uniref:hypothetical protein n=1 Tax=Bradyrhizobium sp. BR 10261 TaxID=2749992 RepID=UPI001C6453EE|nr:hypothetical protein [Bradyrhizobium sp. BR 10261]MBW7965306.1 hypothetical protein [Bradyrhizobium sp. BR 10261]
MELISIGEAARKIGINKSTLSRQVKSGAVRSHGGKVNISEVLADRSNNIDLTQSRRRPAARTPAKNAAAPAADATTRPPDATTRASDATPEPLTGADDELVLADGVMLAFAQAQRVKENYLARQRALEFEKEAGRLVDREAANKAFFDRSREIRDAWLGWPARVATLMASDLGIEERKLVEVLTANVRQHLDELGEPAAPELAPPG